MAMIVDALVGQLVHELLELSKKEVTRLLGVKKNFKRLCGKMKQLKAVLSEAERSEINFESFHSRLSELREVVYDIEDLIDDYHQFEADKLPQTLEDPAAGSSARCGRFIPSCFSSLAFRHRIAWRIDSISTRLEEIHKEKLPLKLLESQPAIHIGVSQADRVTTSRMNVAAVLGIDLEADQMVERLTKGSNEMFLCHAIVGMGGIGKTTLARKVFIDPRIQSHFEVKLWASWVTKKTVTTDILRQILQSAEVNCDQSDAQESMESKVVKLVRGKRVLLVMDDVWDGDVWEDKLKHLLKDSAMNSRLLITTRNNSVANMVGSFETHRKKMLTPEDGWEILRTALGDSVTQERLQRFRSVGMEIVRKCGGLPLSVKLVRGVLKSKGPPRIGDWEAVRDNPSWKSLRDEGQSSKEVIPGLHLSYEELPPNLKQCFLYCSLFPENFTFHKLNLAQMWVAEGFVWPVESRAKEDVALGNFTQLMERSLLQEVPVYFEDWGGTMHNAVRDLAVDICETKYRFQQGSGNLPQGSRHRAFIREGVKEAPSLGELEKRVRTLLLSRNPSITRLPEDYLGKLRRLRILDLSYTGIESLDDSIGKLVQLRFLNVSYTKLKGLPDSIQNLRNLQTLNSTGSESLYRLPDGISRLVNLTDLRVAPAVGQLEQMPVGMGNLLNLRTLKGFVANIEAQGENNMRDLRDLTQLRDLAMYKLEAVTSRAEAQQAGLENKQKLSNLRLSCTPRTDRKRDDDSEIHRIEDIFQGFLPPSRLETLHIEWFFGSRFPDWMSSDSLRDLRWLRLENCKFCKELPPLGGLSELGLLHIWGLSSISSIGAECFGGGTEERSSLPKLETLYFRRMSRWEHWSGLERGALPVLNSLRIVNCPELRSLPEGLCHATSLRHLKIDRADKLKFIKDLPSVTQLTLSNNKNLEEISNLTQLKTMDIRDCPSITQVSHLDVLAHLKLEDSKMDTLPRWLAQTTSLQRLELVCPSDLLSRWFFADDDEWCKIRFIPRINVKSHEGSKYIYYVRSPYSLMSNVTGDAHASSLG